MKEIKTYCDHCNERINEKNTPFYKEGYENVMVSLSIEGDDDFPFPSYDKQVDLCTKCYNQLKDFIKKYIE